MTITYLCSSFTLTSTTTVVTLQHPQHSGMDKQLKKDLQLTDFWSGDYNVTDRGLIDEPLTLTGIEYTTSAEQYACFPWCFPLCFCTHWYNKFTQVDDMMDMNEEVTVTGLPSPFNAVYVIKNWGYRTTGTPMALSWTLTLELVRST